MPVDYQKGKIYKVVDIEYNKCYFGSTCEELSRRMAGHRSDYRRYKDGRHAYVSIFSLFDEYGLDNCKIELVELFPSNRKCELVAREGHYQRHNDCVNKRTSDRKQDEYKRDNSEYFALQRKVYWEKNKEYFSEKGKLYREQNKEKEQERHKKYQDKNSEKFIIFHKNSEFFGD